MGVFIIYLSMVLIITIFFIAISVAVTKRGKKEQKDLSTKFASDPYLTKVFNDIEQDFLSSLRNLPQNKEIYNRIFHDGFYSEQPTKDVKLTVSTSDTGVTVSLTASSATGYQINIIRDTEVSFKDYSISFSGDHREKVEKQLAFSIAVMDRIMKVCPLIIKAPAFHIEKKDNSYEINEFDCEKCMIAYNDIIVPETYEL